MVELAGESVYEPDLEVDLDLYYAYEPDLEVELDLYYANESDLEVELKLVANELAAVAGEINARPPSATAERMLDDDWFGEYDETRVYVEAFEDQPTSPFRKLGNWLLRRAA